MGHNGIRSAGSCWIRGNSEEYENISSEPIAGRCMYWSFLRSYMSLYAVPYVVQPLLAVVQAVCCAALASSVMASRFLVCGIMWRLWSSAAYVQWATSDIGELETYASRARPQYGPTQYSEDQKTSNSGIAQPCLNHGWLMQPVPVRLGISPGEYSAGRHICNVVLYRFAQNMDMSVPTNGQTPEGPRSVF